MKGPVKGTAKSHIALLAAVLAVGAAGCSSGAAKKTADANPATLLSAAVQNAQNVTSIVAATDVKTSQIPGAGLLGSLGLATSGTYTGQTQPSNLREFAGTIQAGGQSMGSIDLISAPSAAYIKLPPMLKALMHGTKQWTKVPESELKSGGMVASLLSEAQSVNPLAFVHLLGESTNTKIAGTATVNGTSTTEVTGSIPASSAMTKLPAGLRSTFSQFGTGQIDFQAWIDAQHNIRKLIVTKAGPNGTPGTTVTFTVTSLNQPVKVTLPPDNQASTLPPAALKGSSLAGL